MFTADVEFPKLAAGSGRVHLVRVLLDLARDADPQLDPRDTLDELSRLADRARRRLGRHSSSRSLKSRLLALSSFLYEDEGFHGDQDDYYHPRNSYLPEVLARRSGLPISLGIIYQYVARRLGLPVYRVATPAHFMVACRSGEVTWYVDPFAGGRVMSRGTCQATLQELLGPSVPIDPSCFQPARVRETVCRVLRNLKIAYAMRDAWPSLVRVQQRLVYLLPDAWNEQRDLGLLLLRTGDPQRAITYLERYVDHETEARREAVVPYLRMARQLLAERN